MKFDFKRVMLAAIPIFLMLSLMPCVHAQSASDPWAQVKKDAHTSERNQRNPDVQARIQQWFIAKIQAYQRVLDDTALGKANPKIIDLGDFSGHLRRILAPPTGTGTAVVLFSDEVSTASTMEDTMDILFPKDRADAYIDQHFETCWHEIHHPITMVSERNGRPVAAKLEDWNLWRKPPTDNYAEHIYIESLGEYTIEWLDCLLHEKSVLKNGGPGLAFEKHCRDAYEQIKQYQARNESVSYAVENYCWAKAHEAWIRGWKQAQMIAPMPQNLRDDYRQIHGVWIGFVEDVIKFYMDGGLTSKDGKKIRVPEWVMWPDPMKSGIIMGHLNEKSEVTSNTLKSGFDVRVLETYRYKERSTALNHGIVNISLENPDGDTKLELAVDGKPIRRSASSGNIDLSSFKKDSTVRITLVRGNLQNLAGKKRYKILVAYKDDPRMVDGKKQPSFYYDSKAIYYVDVTGTGTGSASSSASVKPAGKTPSKPTDVAKTQAKSTGRWVLVDTSTDKRVDDMWKSQKRYRFDSNVELTAATFETVYTDEDEPKRNSAQRTKHSWNHPGQTLAPGVKLPVTMTVTDSGSENVDSTKDGQDANSSLYAIKTQKDSRYGYGVFTLRTTGGPDSGGGGVNIRIGSPKQTKSYTSEVPVPTGKTGDKFVIGIKSMSGVIMAEVEFSYVFENGAPANTTKVEKKAEATLVAEEPKPASDPEQLDNDPPEPGKVIKIKPVKETTPPAAKKPQPAERWYTHTKGDYKFKLPNGWSVSEKHLFDEADGEYDTIWSPKKDMVVICAHSYSSDYSEAAQKKAIQLILKDNPNGKAEYVQFGKVKAGMVGDFVREDGAMGWQVILYHNKRGYHMSVNMQADKKPAKMPDPPAWMLGSIVMLR